MLEAPFDWNTSCFEADQTSSKIFEYIPGDPIGRVHDFNVRFDLGGPELIQGKVNAVVEF